MTTFFHIIVALAGCQLIFLAMKVETKNFRSFLVFKVPSMALGLPLCFFAFGKFMGWPI